MQHEAPDIPSEQPAAIRIQVAEHQVKSIMLHQRCQKPTITISIRAEQSSALKLSELVTIVCGCCTGDFMRLVAAYPQASDTCREQLQSQFASLCRQDDASSSTELPESVSSATARYSADSDHRPCHAAQEQVLDGCHWSLSVSGSHRTVLQPCLLCGQAERSFMQTIDQCGHELASLLCSRPLPQDEHVHYMDARRQCLRESGAGISLERLAELLPHVSRSKLQAHDAWSAACTCLVTSTWLHA